MHPSISLITWQAERPNWWWRYRLSKAIVCAVIYLIASIRTIWHPLIDPGPYKYNFVLPKLIVIEAFWLPATMPLCSKLLMSIHQTVLERDRKELVFAINTVVSLVVGCFKTKCLLRNGWRQLPQYWFQTNRQSKHLFIRQNINYAIFPSSMIWHEELI